MELILNDDQRSACEPSLLCSQNATSSSLEFEGFVVAVVVADDEVIGKRFDLEEE